MKKLLSITAAAGLAISALAWTQINAVPTPAQSAGASKTTVSIFLLSTETGTNLTDETLTNILTVN